MVDVVSVEKRSQMMAGIKAKNTKPEILVRKIVHSLGFRFRLHRKDLPGKPDMVLSRWATVIFVHGCFWHGHNDCPLYRLPRSNTEFWQSKISQNKLRDDEIRKWYDGSSWRYVEIWECALKGRIRLEPDELVNSISISITNVEQSSVQIRGKLDHE